MRRNLFTLAAGVSAVLCAGTGLAYIGTMRVSVDLRSYETVSWLGWLCGFLAVTTVGLLLRRAHQIRAMDQRERRGHCTACGYDLRATPDCCPECGAVPAAKEERA
jgi:hypothetical protein